MAPGQQLTIYARLQEWREGQTRDGRPFIDLKLSDTTGTVAGKIWDDAPKALQNTRALERGAAVKVLFETRSYQGSLQLGVSRIRAVSPEEDPDFDQNLVFGEGYALIEDIRCRTLVFDIETVPDTDLRRAPSTVAQAVAKWAERGDSDESKVMSLSPLFGRVVSVAIGEGEAALDDQEITTLIVPPNGREDDEFPPNMRAMSEPDLLRAFWALAEDADLVVTYNGRGFDVPFLVMRSLIHGIPARVDLLSRPFDLRPHLDLYNVLTQGNRRLGPTSLDVVCWALGFRSPKGEMDGSMVAPVYAQGDIETIATYNAGDVAATTAVYQHVRDHLLRFRQDFNVG
jgi:predicted PolB exonuclease-like 3'-5' exonuclease